MIEHLAALQVAIPLIAAPASILLRRPSWMRLFAVVVTWSCFAMSLGLLVQVVESGTISYALGGWAAPWGIEYRVDLLNGFVLMLISGIASVILPIGYGTVGDEAEGGRDSLFYPAFLLCLTGLLGVTITGDIFNVFVFLEIASLSSYTLISLGRDRRALKAAFSYLTVGTIGGVFILIAISFLYQMTGTLNIVDLAERLPAVLDTKTARVAFAFMCVGISIKLALFPLHQWLPNAYAFAPTLVSAFLAATATKVAFYLLVRVIFGVFGAVYVFETLGLSRLLIPLSFAAAFVGSIAAIYQTDLKRLLAYSSIAQIGYLTLGLSMANESGLTGAIVHIFNHGIIKAGLFLVVASIIAREGSSRIEDLAGIAHRMPLTFAAFVVGGLGLIGVPGTAGFVSKWYLLLGAIERGWMGVAVLLLLSSLLAAVYVWRIVEIAWFRESPSGATAREAPASLLIPTWILAAATLYFGFFTEWTVGIGRAAAQALLAAGP
jgi:multicomponent Na+:H+ antiporter subunit D